MENLSIQMESAVAYLDRADYLPGVVAAPGCPSALSDGQAWINFRTAKALERRGLVCIVWRDEGGDIYPRHRAGGKR
jgi:hypothetical protein